MAKQLNVSLAFTADTGKAKAQIQDLQKTLSQIASATHGNDTVFITKELKEAQTVAAQLQVTLQNAFNTKTGSLDLTKFNDSLKKGGLSLKQVQDKLYSMGPAGEQAFSQLAHSITLAEVPLRRSSTLLDQFKTSLMNTARWQISSSILHGFMGTIQGAIGYAEDLNKSLNNIRIVTGMSTDQMAQFAEQANKAAQALSTRTTDYTDAALIYYQQGIRDQNEIAARTETTLKLANVSHQSAQQVSDQMTAIWNNFDDGTQSLEYYADVITALGATTASSSEEISKGLEKFAAVADTVGLSYENAAAAVATIVAETRQSADTVGTGLRTLFSRLQSLKLGETLEDGVGLSKYSAALESVGVKVLDINGEVRDMDDILGDLGAKWNDISDSQQIALAQTVGGVRQYTNLIALMDNWDKMQENVNVASGSEGTLQKQQDIYAESWEAASKRVKAAAEEIYQSILDDDFFIGLNDGFATVLNGISKFIESIGGVKGVLISLGAIFSNIFQKEIASGLSNMAHNITMMTGKGRETAKQAKIDANNLLINQSVNNGTMSGAMAADAYKAAAQAQLSYINNVDRMSEGERAVNQILLERNQTLADQAAEMAKMAEQAQRQETIQQAAMRSRMKNMSPNDANIVESSMQEFEDDSARFAQLSVAHEAIYNAGHALEGFGSGATQDLESTIAALETFQQELKDSGLSIDELKSRGGVFEEIGTALENIKPDSSLGELNSVIDDVKNHTQDLTNAVGDAQVKLEMSQENFMSNASAARVDDQAIKNYVNSVNESNNATEESKVKLSQARAVALEHADAMDKAKNSTMTMSTALSKTFGAAMSLAMAWRQLNGMFETLNDSSASFSDKLMSVLMTLGMVGPAITGTIIPAVASLGKHIEIAGVASKVTFGHIALIVGAITALVIAIPKVAKFFGLFQESSLEKATNELNKLKGASDEATEHLETVRQKYESLCQDFDEYTSIIENLHSCKKGTDEWNEALEQTSNMVSQLLEQYPELASYALVKDKESGLWVVDKAKFEEVKKEYEEREMAARTASTLASARQEQAQQGVDSEQHKENLSTMKADMRKEAESILADLELALGDYWGQFSAYFTNSKGGSQFDLINKMANVSSENPEDYVYTLAESALYNTLGDSGIWEQIGQGLTQTSTLEDYAKALDVSFQPSLEGLLALAQALSDLNISDASGLIADYGTLIGYLQQNADEFVQILSDNGFLDQMVTLRNTYVNNMDSENAAYLKDISQYQETMHTAARNLLVQFSQEYGKEIEDEGYADTLADTFVRDLFGSFDENIGDYSGGLVDKIYKDAFNSVQEGNFDIAKNYLDQNNLDYQPGDFRYDEESGNVFYKDLQNTEKPLSLWNLALQSAAQNLIETDDYFQSLFTNLEEASQSLKDKIIESDKTESAELKGEAASKFATNKNFNGLTQEEIAALMNPDFSKNLNGTDLTAFGFGEVYDEKGFSDKGRMAYLNTLEEANELHQEAVKQTQQIRDNLEEAGEEGSKFTDDMFASLQSIYTQLSSGVLGSKMGDSFLNVIADILSQLDEAGQTEFLSQLESFDFSETGLLDFSQQLSDAGFNIDNTSEAWTTFIQNINENQPNLPDYNGFIEQLKGVASVIQSLDYGAIIKEDEFNNLIAFYGDLANKFTDLADGRHQFLGTHDELMSAIQDELKVQKEQAKTNVELAEQIKAPEGGYLSTLNTDKSGSYNKYNFKKNILDDESVMKLLDNIGYKESRVNEIFSNLQNSTEGAVEEAKQLYTALDAALNGDYKNIDQTEQVLASLATTMEELYSMTEGKDPLVNSVNAVDRANILLSQSSSLDDFNKNLALMQDMNIEPSTQAVQHFVESLSGADFYSLENFKSFIEGLPVSIGQSTDAMKKLMAEIISNDSIATTEQKIANIKNELGDDYVAQHFGDIIDLILNNSSSTTAQKIAELNKLLQEGAISGAQFREGLERVLQQEESPIDKIQTLQQSRDEIFNSYKTDEAKNLSNTTNLNDDVIDQQSTDYANIATDNYIQQQSQQTVDSMTGTEFSAQNDLVDFLDSLPEKVSVSSELMNNFLSNLDFSSLSELDATLGTVFEKFPEAEVSLQSYADALLGIASQYENTADESERYQMVVQKLTEVTNNGTEAERQAVEESEAKARSQLRAATLAGQFAKAYNFSAEVIENYADELKQSGKFEEASAEGLVELAKDQLRYNRALDSSSKNMSKWKSAVDKAQNSVGAMNDVVEDMQDAYGDLLDIDGSKLSSSFLKNAHNLELMNTALNGTEDEAKAAYDELQEIARQDLAVQFGIDDAEFQSKFNTLLGEYYDAQSLDDIEVGAALNDEGFLQGLTDMVNAAGMSAAEATDYLSSMGIDAQVEEEPVEEEEQVATKVTGTPAPVDVPYNIPTITGSGSELSVSDNSGTAIFPGVDYTSEPIMGDKKETAIALKVTSANKSSGGGIKKSGSGGGGGGGKGGCFAAGTFITTLNGYKKIEDIQKGDIVLSYNEDTMKNEYSEVMQTMIHLVYDDIYTLYIEDEKLVVTGIHKFLITRFNQQDWIQASKLRVGDLVLFADGTLHFISQIDVEKKAIPVYNFEVSNNHNYYVGYRQILAHNKGGGCFIAGTSISTLYGFKNIENIKIGDIVLSHNEHTNRNEYSEVLQTMMHLVYEDIYTLYIENESITATGIHKFLICRNGIQKWVKASHLQVGDLVFFADGTWHAILDISMRIKAEVVYNFEVSGNHNYYVGKNQILAHNKGGGGGKAKTPQKKDLKKSSDEIERYHKIRAELKDLTDNYEKISKAKDKAFGPDRVRQLNREIDAQNKLIKKQQQYIDEIREYRDKEGGDKDQIAAYGAQFDAMGNISNYDQIMQQQLDKYNAVLEKYNSMSAEEQESEETKKMLEEAEKAYEDFKKILQQYEETNELLQEQQEELNDQVQHLYDLGREKIEYVVSVRLEYDDSLKNYLDYLKEEIAAFNDDLDATIENMGIFDREAARIMDRNDTVTKGITDTLMQYFTKGTYTNTNGETISIANLIKENKVDPNKLLEKYLNNEELTDEEKEILSHMSESEMKYLGEMRDELISNNQAILQLIEDFGENMRNAVDATIAKLEEAKKPIERANKLYNHLNNLIDTIGQDILGVNNEFMGRLDDYLVQNANDALSAAVTSKKAIEAELATVRAEMAKVDREANAAVFKQFEETEKKLMEELENASDEVYAKAEEAANVIRAKFEHEVDRVTKDKLNEMAQKSGYDSWASLKEQMEYANKAADRYVAQYKEIYELSKLNRDINKSIDETDNVKNKQRLRDLQKEINKLEEKSGEVSQYELDNARRRYELELARLELEEAGNIKDTVRLSKDSEGNWSYIYTASEEDVAAAEQNYEDKLYAMQEANAEYIQELQDLQIKEAEEYAQKLAEIMLDESRTIEDRNNAAKALTGAFEDQMKYLGEQGEIVLNENKRLYDEDWTWYSNFTKQKADAEDEWDANTANRYSYRLGDAEKYVDTWRETFLGAHADGFGSATSLAEGWTKSAEECYQKVSDAAKTYATDVATALQTAGYEVTTAGGQISGFAEQAEQDMGKAKTASQEAANAIKDVAKEATNSFKTLLDKADDWVNKYNDAMQKIIDKNKLVIKSMLDVEESLTNFANQQAADNESQEAIQDSNANNGNGNNNNANNQPQATTRDRIWAVFNLINSGKVDTNPVRPAQIQALGYTAKEAELGQKFVNAYYPRSLGGTGNWDKEAAFKAIGLDTGGYTGDWSGEGGKLAILHSKELVLNEKDTSNILSAVDMVRKLASVIDMGAKITEYALGNLSAQSGAFSGQQIEQTITINAEFPNATDHSEIEQAFNNLINEATQYANRKNF